MLRYASFNKIAGGKITADLVVNPLNNLVLSAGQLFVVRVIFDV